MGSRAIATRRYAPRLPADERRRQILDRTLELIATDGYGASTMEAIARAVGVAKPVVYDLFGTRGDLLRELLQREERRALAQLAEVIPGVQGGGSIRAMIVEGFEAFVRVIGENPDAWRLILLPAEATPRVVREHVDRGRAQVVTQLQALVEWGADQLGLSLEEVDSELAAHAFLGLGEHSARLALADPGRFPPERFGRMAGLLVDTIAGSRPPSSR